ncbi:MAG: hypothetical protein M5T52_06860 [Ignavibacteriaceae bacterium]|nr:hypothetical protein [Ignavibacteriaceae bacterium]
MFDGLSNFVNSFDTTFLVVLIVCVFFLTLITVLMLVFVFKYSRKKNPRGTNIHGNVALEITMDSNSNNTRTDNVLVWMGELFRNR